MKMEKKKIKDMTDAELREYKRIKAREARSSIRITVTDPEILKLIAAYVSKESK